MGKTKGATYGLLSKDSRVASTLASRSTRLPYLVPSSWMSPSRRCQKSLMWLGVLVALNCAGEQKSTDDGMELSSNTVENGANSDANIQDSSQGESSANKNENNKNSSDPYDNDWNNLNSKKNASNAKSKNESNQQKKSDLTQNTNSNTLEIEDDNSVPSNQIATNQGTVNVGAANQTAAPTNNVLPVNNLPPPEEPPLDQEPAPQVFEASVDVPPESSPIAAAPSATETSVAPMPSPISGEGRIIRSVNRPDLEPKTANLHWVGFDYSEREGVVRVQMVTRGVPKYNIFQERNGANQPELVVRFFNTSLRKKLRRDINCSEFRSPVAYVRMRPNSAESYVDVIMTMRDPVQPRLFNKYGNVMLTFAIPDHYFGTSTVGDSAVARAETFPNSHILPEIDQGSVEPESIKVAKAYTNNPGKDVFQSAPANGGEAVAPAPAPEPTPDLVPVGEDPLISEPATIDQTMINAALPPESNNPVASGNTGNLSGNLPPVGNENLSEASQGGNVNFSQQGNAQTGTQGINSANGTNGNDQASDDQGEGQEESQNQENPDDTLDSNSIENLDNGNGESADQSNKFEVRNTPQSRPMMNEQNTDIIVESFSLFGVAQDNFGPINQQNAQSNTPPKKKAKKGDENTQNQENSGSNPNNANLGLNNGNNGGANANSSNANPQSAGNPGSQLAGNNATLNNAGGSQLNGGQFPQANNTASPNLGTNSTGNSGGNFGLTNGATNTGNQLANVPANAPANVPANAPANPSLGATNAVGANAFATEQGVPTNATTPVLAPVTETVPAGEPPVQGQPDLTGAEQVGQETEEPAQAPGVGRPIKLDFRGAPLSEVVRVLSDESGINFVLTPEVGAIQVFINLAGVPFQDALKAVLEANSLGMVQVSPNIVRIDTLEKIAKDKEEVEKKRKAELRMRPEKILVYRLNYASAEKVAPLLSQMIKKQGDENQNEISVSTESRTNSVVVKAPASELATIKVLLERLDLETPQVKIASRIVEVLKSSANNLGISWGGPFNFDQGRGLGFGNLVFPNYGLARYSVDAGGTENSRVGNFQGRIGSLNNSMAFDLALALEETRGTSEILQSSNLIVQDNEKAKILDGKTDFFPPPPGSIASAAGEAIRYQLTMEVQPHITADGAVQMNVNIQSDSPTTSVGAGARTASLNRSIETKLLRRSGETAVIGGVYTMSKLGKKAGIPYLQSIPIIGALFRSNETSESKKELLVLVTPTIISGVRGGDGGSSGGEAPPASGNFGGNGNSQAVSDDGDLTGGGNVGTNSIGSLQSQQGTQASNGSNGQGNNGSQNAQEEQESQQQGNQDN